MISFAVKTHEAEANKPKHLHKGFILGFIKGAADNGFRMYTNVTATEKSLYMTVLF